MAKKGTILFRLLSSAGTGFTYIGSKNSKYFIKLNLE
jgi:ribosomal protein L33